MAAFEGDFDYIIVGAGTAGCVLANRLSEDATSRVLLIEAGGRDTYPWIHIPVGYLYCMGNPRTDWMMKTGAEPGLNGRSLNYPRGKTLGGCTSINGMIYMRGQSADYDRWAQMGNAGWGWDDVLPYFRKSEDHHSPDAELHSAGGEWKVSKQRLSWDVLKDVQKAAIEFGIPFAPDFNDGINEGVGFFDVNQKGGVRWSTAKAFLKPAEGRANLKVVTNALVTGLMLDGKRVTGVEWEQGGTKTQAKAAREVILSAGSLNSPKLMELSGIGDPEVLGAHGIEVKHALPGVGKNLQDHLQIRTAYKLTGAKTLNQLTNSLVGKAKMGLEYALKRSGPLSMAPSQLGIFTRSDETVDTPDLEYHIQPLTTDKLGDPLHKFPGITVSVCDLRPDSRGTSHIQSTDANVQPDIRLNYLSAEKDKIVAVRAVKQSRELMKMPAMARYEPEEFLPGPALVTDEEILKGAGDVASTIFHPVGTTKMGSDDMAVVGADLKVHGLEGLRVVDAGIMPTLVSGNTASPVIMIAEKAADMILSRA